MNITEKEMRVLKELLREVASNNEEVYKEFAAAITIPILQEITLRSVVRELFNVEVLEPGTQAVYPVADDFEVPVWVLPGIGYMAQNFVEGAGEDVYVPVFSINASADWKVSYARDARTDILQRCIRKAAQAIAEYEEESGWRVLVPAGTTDFAGQGLLKARPAPIYQVPAGSDGAGFLSPALINRMIVGMERTDRTLTDLWVSPEDAADIRLWTETEIDPVTRREIFQASGMGSVWNVTMHKLPHLGAQGKFNINGAASGHGIFKESGGSFNDYTTDNANIVDSDGQVTTAGETQVWGFDLSVNDSLVMPIKKEYEPIMDPTLLRRQKQGFFGWQECGFAVLDGRMICIGVIDRSL